MNLMDIEPNSELKKNLRDYLNKHREEIEIGELADKFEKPPKIIRAVLEKIKQDGFNIEYAKEREEKVSLVRGSMTAFIDIDEYFQNEIKIGIISDTHLVSTKCDLKALKRAYELFRRHEVQVVLHAGNCIDGEKTYEGHEYELLFVGFEKQIDYFVNEYPYIEGIKTKMICSSTCHEGKYFKMMGMEIGKRIALQRNDIKYLGLDCADIYFGNEKKTDLRIMHPGGGSSYALSYKPQKIIESFSGGNKPNILILGHYHKSGFFTIRNVHTILAASTQNQTRFMLKHTLESVKGCYILEFQTYGKSVISFKPTFFPFY